MPNAALTSKGQMTVPKEVRAHLQLRVGDRVDFLIEPDGRVVIQPLKVEVTALRGLLHRRRPRAVSIDDMKAAIRRRGGRVR